MTAVLTIHALLLSMMKLVKGNTSQKHCAWICVDTINIEGNGIEKRYVRDMLVESLNMRWQHIEAPKTSNTNDCHKSHDPPVDAKH